jgi:hypothetical protein
MLYSEIIAVCSQIVIVTAAVCYLLCFSPLQIYSRLFLVWTLTKIVISLFRVIKLI